MNLKLAWNIADITMAAMATINIIAIFLLSKVVIIAVKDYEAQRRAGLNPEFDPESLASKIQAVGREINGGKFEKRYKNKRSVA